MLKWDATTTATTNLPKRSNMMPYCPFVITDVMTRGSGTLCVCVLLLNYKKEPHHSCRSSTTLVCPKHPVLETVERESFHECLNRKKKNTLVPSLTPRPPLAPATPSLVGMLTPCGKCSVTGPAGDTVRLFSMRLEWCNVKWIFNTRTEWIGPGWSGSSHGTVRSLARLLAVPNFSDNSGVANMEMTFCQVLSSSASKRNNISLQ